MSDISGPVLLGALLGWTRYPLPRGSVVRIQVARANDRVRDGEYDEFDIGMSALQLRTLGEDLIRAADEREGRPGAAARRRWWQL